jgi:uncharacterized protein (DUF58 family)
MQHRDSMVTQWLDRADRALNHDFCPRADRGVDWLKKPVTSLMLAIGISLVCGFLLNPQALLITVILVTVLGLGVCLPWLAVRGIEANVQFDVRRVRVGQSVVVRLRLTNRFPWPVWGLSIVRGFALDESATSGEGVSLSRIPGRSTIDSAWTFVPRSRGTYPLTPPEIETGFPFGLYRASRRALVDGSLIVWPETVALPGLPDAMDDRLIDDLFADRRTGDFGDMLGTRHFRNGDSLRRIHWGQTARQRQLIVVERQAPATVAVRVFLETDSAAYSPSEFRFGRNQEFELAVSVAASVCESLHDQNCRVELQLSDQLCSAGRGSADFHRVMDLLAAAQLTTEPEPASSPTVRSRRQAGFFVRVSGVGRRTTQSSPGVHDIVVDTSPARERPVPSYGWLVVHGWDEFRHQLPRCWKGACNAR